MMGSIFAGTEESPGKNLKLKTNYIKFIEEWGLLEQCHLGLHKDTSKKIIKINRNLFLRELRAEYYIKESFRHNISIARA